MSEAFQPSTQEELNYQLPYEVTSSPQSAFGDPFNQKIIVSLGSAFLFSLIILILDFSWGWTMMMALSLLAIYIYSRAILNRRILITEETVSYVEASRKIVLSWDEIDAIIVEPHRGQITFWTDGKRKRIHEFGLPERERTVARLLLMNKAHSEKIELSIK